MNGASNPAGSGTGSTRLATKVDQATQTPENIGRETRNFTLKALKLQLNVTPNTLNLRFEFLFSLSHHLACAIKTRIRPYTVELFIPKSVLKVFISLFVRSRSFIAKLTIRRGSISQSSGYPRCLSRFTRLAKFNREIERLFVSRNPPAHRIVRQRAENESRSLYGINPRAWKPICTCKWRSIRPTFESRGQTQAIVSPVFPGFSPAERRGDRWPRTPLQRSRKPARCWAWFSSCSCSAGPRFFY